MFQEKAAAVNAKPETGLPEACKRRETDLGRASTALLEDEFCQWRAVCVFVEILQVSAQEVQGMKSAPHLKSLQF